MNRPGPVVEVTWRDSLGHHGWHDPDSDDHLLDELDCRSVGYLVVDDERGVVIVQSVQKDGRDNSTAIPRSAVGTITILSDVNETGADADSPGQRGADGIDHGINGGTGEEQTGVTR